MLYGQTPKWIDRLERLMPGLGIPNLALYLNNLDMGTDSLLMISSNVQVYFISSNNWTLANVQLLGNPNYNQTFDGIHQLVVVPEPAIVLLWLSSIATVYAARRRNGRSAARTVASDQRRSSSR